MVLLKHFKKLIPSFRHKKIISIYDNKFVFFKKVHKKHKTPIKHIKRFDILLNRFVTPKMWNFSNYIVKNFNYRSKPYKKYIYCQSLDNSVVIIPGIEFVNVGTILYSYKYLIKKNVNFFFKGFITYLHTIPITVTFCNVLNKADNKLTFAKSTGTYCKTQKIKKTKLKLIVVILPSTEKIHINKYSKAYIGKNENLKINELVEGKWGFSLKTKKHIHVRGVAKNPVDHPNGGRTKTVQPERSPWNWVAKKKK